MDFEPDGKLVAVCQGERCEFECVDVPYIVRDVEDTNDEIVLVFQGGYKEALNPGTLFVGEKDVLYCKVRENRFIARFSRNAYFRFMKELDLDDTGRYGVRLGGVFWPIRPASLTE
jgi:hypothetical protein